MIQKTCFSLLLLAIKKEKKEKKLMELKEIKECCICLTGYDQEKCKILSCGHNFHKNCIQKWFLKRGEKECPYCRQNHSELKIIALFCSDLFNSIKEECSCTDHYTIPKFNCT